MDISNFFSVFRAVVRDKNNEFIESYPVNDRNRWYIIRDNVEKDNFVVLEFYNGKTKIVQKEKYGYSELRNLIKEARIKMHQDEEERIKKEQEEEEDYYNRMFPNGVEEESEELSEEELKEYEEYIEDEDCDEKC